MTASGRREAGAVGAPTKADNAALKRQAAAKTVTQRAAYEAGLAGERPGFYDDPLDEQAYQAGRDARDASARSPSDASSRARGDGSRRGPRSPASSPSRAGSPTGSSPGRLVSGQDGAGVLLAFVGYAVAINFLRGGAPQVRRWFAAKFLNQASGTRQPAAPLPSVNPYAYPPFSSAGPPPVP
ncbi:MAG TPA: hypothetical protein VKQ71_17635 [Acidimicrobiales bacterium]|nr:hypothetical protein [Acidimicrobiales bacterium]